MGATLTVKGVEYNIGDDELELPDDPKGDTKVDAQGRLLGGECSALTILLQCLQWCSYTKSRPRIQTRHIYLRNPPGS